MPNIEDKILIPYCVELSKIPYAERFCIYDRLLFRLRNRDKKLAKKLEEHWNQHLKFK